MKENILLICGGKRKMKIRNKRGMIVVSIVMIILICIAFTTKTFQNDTFYTIKIGQSILKHGIDMKDHFSWHGLPYTYPHWLYDIGTYKIYQLGGLHGLYLMTIVIFMITGVSFYLVNIKRNKSYFISLLFSIMAIIMVARFATARAQLVSYLLFLLEIYFIEQLLVTGKKKYGFILFIICLLIANLHAAVWPMYFILMLPYLFEYLVAIISNKIKHKPKLGVFGDKLVVKKNNNIKYLLIVFGVSLLIGLLTPIGFTPYTYFIKIVMGNTTQYIDEHKPLILIQNLFVIGYLAIMLVPLIFTKVKIRLSDFAMMGGLLLMAFISTRHVALLGIVGMFYLCRLIANIGKINTKYVLDYDLPWYGIFVVLITMIVTAGFVYSINSKQEFINSYDYPVEMVKWMKKNLDMDKVKLYNDYDFGSYLMYKNIPVYIDSRSDLYTKPFNGKNDIFDECMNITENYGRVFKKYDITHILIYKNTYLNQILAVSSNYELVHKEGRFMLYKYLANTDEKDGSVDEEK